jgi:hypothetical protein
MTERPAPPLTSAKLDRVFDMAREKGFRVVLRPDGVMVCEPMEANPQGVDKPLADNEEIIL